MQARSQKFPNHLAIALGLVGAIATNSFAPHAGASQSCTDDTMLVFDGSSSMAETGFNRISRPRIQDARQAMREVMPAISAVRRMGLVIYGPGRSDACSNIALKFPPIEDAGELIIQEVEALIPEGHTPLTQAVRRAAEVLIYRKKPGSIVIVTDGTENCGGAPCALAAQLRAESFNLTVHVIGFKVRGNFLNWKSNQRSAENDPLIAISRCLADLNGGKYVSTESVGELVSALRTTLACPAISAISREMDIS